MWSSAVIRTSQDSPTSNNLSYVYLRVNSSSGNCFLAFVVPKVWSSILECIKSTAIFTFKWQLTKHLLHEKDTWLYHLESNCFTLSKIKCCFFDLTNFPQLNSFPSFMYIGIRSPCSAFVCFAFSTVLIQFPSINKRGSLTRWLLWSFANPIWRSDNLCLH